MDKQQIHTIKVEGYTVVKIERYEEGLRLLTHKNARVDRDGTMLTVTDPSNGVSSGVTVSVGKTLLVKNLISIGGTVVYGDGVTITNNNDSEQDTEHLIQCGCDNVDWLECAGAMRLTIDNVPLSPNSSVFVHGSSSIVLTGSRQHFDRLKLNVYGSGSINAKALSIEQLSVDIEGSGCVNLVPLAINTAYIVVTGSGKASLGDSNIETMTCYLNGSGSIVDFNVLAKAVCDLNGPGIIDCRAKHTAKLTETTTGGARIHVTRYQ